MIKIINNYLKIDSVGNSLIIAKHDNRAELVYYGKKIKDYEDYSYFAVNKDKYFASNSDYTNMPSVMASNGECAQKSCLVSVVKNGIFTNRFEYISANLVEGFDSPLPTARRKGQTVRLDYVDVVSGVELKQYFTVFDDSNVIATHTEIINTCDCPVTVNKLMSLQLDFVAQEATVSSFDGTWEHERSRHDANIKGGRFEISSILGISSAEHNPFMIAKVNRGILGLNLIWSGNHKEIVEVSPYGRVRIQTGMNDYQLNYVLNPGERLVAPEAIVVYAKDEAEITYQMHKFILNHIINPKFAYKERPILINNWEGTYFNFTGDKIYAIAEKASRCGIEMLVLDDGWFGVRDTDRTGLGDWFDNVGKTGGLKNLADRIKGLGMKFGLWVEPEMISPDSDIFRAHPEFAQAIPGVEPIQRRSQLCMDMCNPEVVKYLSNILIKLFKDTGVDYVKWDHNRSMSDIYSRCLDNQGRFFYDYYLNQYEMLKQITEACPDILFESCSSGGCRYDLGMFYYMPQCWGSDNTNAFHRIFIQEGTLIAYPQSSMGAHVAASNSLPEINIESRFNIASAGAFGYEFDITTSSDEELEIIKKQVSYYKEHRKLLQYGNYVKLGGNAAESDYTGWMIVSDDKKEAIAVVIDKSEDHGFGYQKFYFDGLKEDSIYKVSMRPQSNVNGTIEFEAYGDALMNGGLDFKYMKDHEVKSIKESGRFASRMFYINEIK